MYRSVGKFVRSDTILVRAGEGWAKSILFHQAVREVFEECGVLLADTNDIQPGDNLEVFEVEERERTL